MNSIRVQENFKLNLKLSELNYVDIQYLPKGKKKFGTEGKCYDCLHPLRIRTLVWTRFDFSGLPQCMYVCIQGHNQKAYLWGGKKTRICERRATEPHIHRTRISNWAGQHFLWSVRRTKHNVGNDDNCPPRKTTLNIEGKKRSKYVWIIVVYVRLCEACSFEMKKKSKPLKTLYGNLTNSECETLRWIVVTSGIICILFLVHGFNRTCRAGGVIFSSAITAQLRVYVYSCYSGLKKAKGSRRDGLITTVKSTRGIKTIRTDYAENFFLPLSLKTK